MMIWGWVLVIHHFSQRGKTKCEVLISTSLVCAMLVMFSLLLEDEAGMAFPIGSMISLAKKKKFG